MSVTAQTPRVQQDVKLQGREAFCHLIRDHGERKRVLERDTCTSMRIVDIDFTNSGYSAQRGFKSNQTNRNRQSHQGEDDRKLKDKVIQVRGSAGNVARAVVALNELIASFPDCSDVSFMIPNNAVKSVIGRHGENIRRLRHNRSIKIDVDPEGKGGTSDGTPIVLYGKEDDIEWCRREIMKIVERRPGNAPENEANGDWQVESESESPKAAATDELKILTREMFAFYANPRIDAEFRTLLTTEGLSVGDVVAARHSKRLVWCRAKVVSIDVNEDYEPLSNLSVKYVDDEGGDLLPLSWVRRINPVFLELPFQGEAD